MDKGTLILLLGEDEDDLEPFIPGPEPAIRVQQTQQTQKRRRPQHGQNKIDAAKLANLKKDFPGLAEALGGLFLQGEARVRRHEEEEHGERPQGQEQDDSILNQRGPLSLHKGD